MKQSNGHTSKGQVATEFLMYTAVFMCVAVAAYLVINATINTDIPIRQNAIAKSAGDDFITSFFLAVRAGDGFTYKYTFPRTILTKPYALSFTDKGNMILDWAGDYGNFSQSYALPPFIFYFDASNGCLEKKANAVDQTNYYYFNSTKCSNVLTMTNKDGVLTVIHNA